MIKKYRSAKEDLCYHILHYPIRRIANITSQDAGQQSR